jgi:hypothetical protein
MSRWLYQMSESSWPSENYRKEVREGTQCVGRHESACSLTRRQPRET